MKTEKYELMALRLRKHLKQLRDIDLSDEDSVDTIAVLHGFRDWFSLQEKISNVRITEHR